MALIVCPDCTRQVSPKARFCVNCGRPRPGASGHFRKIVMAIVLVAIAGGGYAATSYWNNNKEFRVRTMATLDSISDELKQLRDKVGGAPSKAEKLPTPSQNEKDQKELDRKRSD